MTTEMLTELEKEAMELTGRLAGVLRKIIGDGPQAKGDWAEMAHEIHDIQSRILAQAASRAYPELYRPLGGFIEIVQPSD